MRKINTKSETLKGWRVSQQESFAACPKCDTPFHEWCFDRLLYDDDLRNSMTIVTCPYCFAKLVASNFNGKIKLRYGGSYNNSKILHYTATPKK